MQYTTAFSRKTSFRKLDRRGLSQIAIFLAAAIGSLCSRSPANADEKPRASSRPNIVFILADDLGYGELGCYGQTKIRTPNLDRLAAEGMRFTQHYSGAPVCAPARCVLMTGKHLGHAQIRGNRQAQQAFPQYDEGQHPIAADTVTFPSLLRQAGYATAAMGKWGLGPVGSTGDPNRHGFDLFYGYNSQSVAHSYYPRFLWRNERQVEINPMPIAGHQKQPTGDVKMETYLGKTYAPDAMLAEALTFLDARIALSQLPAKARAPDGDKPFFLYLPFVEPHLAIHPPRDRVEAYPAEWDAEVYRGETGYLPHPRPRAAYAAMISNLDRCVGEVLKKLDAAGLREETLIVFTSDNGATHAHAKTVSKFHVGGVDTDFFRSTADLRGYKGSVYEGGLRVPTIVSRPGTIKAGAVNDSPSYFADWFPTLCEAAGLAPLAPSVAAGLDGESLLPTLTTDKPLQRTKPMVWVFPEYGGQVAVRLGDYKVVRQGLKTKTPGAWEVYDLAHDRSETKNLASEKPEVVAQAIAVLMHEVSPNEVFPLVIPGVTIEGSSGQ